LSIPGRPPSVEGTSDFGPHGGKPVIAEMVRLAAFEVPGVQAVARSAGHAEAAPGSPVEVRLQGNRVTFGCRSSRVPGRR